MCYAKKGEQHSGPVAALLGKLPHRQDQAGYGFYIAYHTLRQHEQPAWLDVRCQDDAFDKSSCLPWCIQGLGYSDH